MVDDLIRVSFRKRPSRSIRLRRIDRHRLVEWVVNQVADDTDLIPDEDARGAELLVIIVRARGCRARNLVDVRARGIDIGWIGGVLGDHDRGTGDTGRAPRSSFAGFAY